MSTEPASPANAGVFRRTLKRVLPAPVTQALIGAVIAYNKTAHAWSLRWRASEVYVEAARAKLFPPRVRVETLHDNGAFAAGAVGKVAIFCHYDAAGNASPAVVHYLAALRAAEFQIMVVSSAPRLTQEAVRAMAAHACMVLRRDNVGYDFGCFREGVLLLGDLSRVALLALANDSVIGPFAPLAPLIARMDDSADVWGLTDSRDHFAHLQSYFLAFRPNALRRRAFLKFWRGYALAPSKDWAIRAGELGLSRAMTRAGLTLKALFPFEDLQGAYLLENAQTPADSDLSPLSDVERVRALTLAGAPINPTHYYWRLLIQRFGFPFIKRELIARNPEQLSGVELWRQAVGAVFGREIVDAIAPGGDLG